MVGEADVVDDEAALFVLRHPVDAGDGLQQVVLAQPLVEIHHLLHRRVETGQQHVADDQEGNTGQILVRVVEVEGLAEVLDGVPAFRLLARLGDRRQFIGGVGRDHHRSLEKGDATDQLCVGLRLETLLVEAFGERAADRLLVAERGQLGVADYLRLEAVGEDVVDVVVDQVAGNRRNALLGFEDVAAGAVLLADRRQLVLAALTKQVLELGVEAVLVLQRRVSGAVVVMCCGWSSQICHTNRHTNATNTKGLAKHWITPCFIDGTRDGTRTRTAQGQGILSPQCLPIPPPGRNRPNN